MHIAPICGLCAFAFFVAIGGGFAVPAQAQTVADDIRSIEAQAQIVARDALKAPCDTDISEYVNKLQVYKRQLETLRNSWERRKDDLNEQEKAKLKELSDLIPQFGGSPGGEYAQGPATGVGVDAAKDVAKDAIKKGIEKQLGSEVAEKAGEAFAGGVVEGLAKGIDAAKVAKDLMEKMDIDIAREGILTDAVNIEAQLQLATVYEGIAQKARDTVEGLITRLDAKEKCPPPTATGVTETPPPGGLVTPGPRVATGVGTTVGGTDGPTWCGYGPGTSSLFPFFPIDSFTPPNPQTTDGTPTTPGGPPTDGPKTAQGPQPGTPTTPGGTPTIPTTPTTPDTPKTPDTPTIPTGGTPTTPNTPTNPPPTPTGGTPATPPPTPTTSIGEPPPPITPTPNVTIFVKATESVLEGGQTGNPIDGQNIALFPFKPALPVFDNPGPTGNDFGFNRDPARCTTGTNGGCTIPVMPDDRPLFGFPNSPGNAFGMNIEPKKVNGGLLTGDGPTPNFTPLLPNGVTPVFGDPFNVNGETFTPVFFNFPFNVPFDVSNLQPQIPNLLVDFCFTKQPGPPLGMEPESYSALNRELPQASVTIERIRRTIRRAAR